MLLSALRPWTWLHRVPTAVARENAALAVRLKRSWRTVFAVARVDVRRRYAGSALGLLWYPLHSALLLGMYCFVYMVVFAQRLEEMGSYEYVLFIFAGLVPYLAFSEALMSSISSVKANVALVRNSVFPIELVPLKTVLVSLAGSTITLGLLLLLIAPTGFRGWHLLYLPVPMLLLALLCLGATWLLGAVAALVPDVTYLVGIVVLALVFLSPIGFTVDQVPPSARFVVWLNPLTYLIDSFRAALLGIRSLPWWTDGVALVSLALFGACSAAVFRRLMPLFADHE